jgi:hypothetical protein
MIQIHKSGATVVLNNYQKIIVDHTFSKLCATTLHLLLSKDPERRHLPTRVQAGFIPEHLTTDHILTLWAIIEEAKHQSLKVLFCFIDF